MIRFAFTRQHQWLQRCRPMSAPLCLMMIPAFLFPIDLMAQSRSPLKLNDVLESVARYYPQIKIARLDVKKSQGDYLTALGKFDPSLGLNTASQPMGGYINNYGNTEINLPTLYNGLKLFSGYRNGQGNWPIYYQNYLTNSGGEYRAGLSFPLLRDRLIDEDRAKLLTESETIRMKQQQAAVIQIKVYQEAITAYWQWVQAGLQVNAFKKLLALAATRQRAIIKQAHQGDLPMLAIAENKQLIIQRQQLLNQGNMIFEQACIHLSLYYRDKQGKPMRPKANKLPLTVLSSSVHPADSLLQVQQHPALKKLQNYSNVLKIKQQLAKNEFLPNLDATAYTFKQYGTGGYALLLPQAAMVGVSFKFPVLQRQAKGKWMSAQSEWQQVMTEKQFLFDQLTNQLTNLLIGIKMYHHQVQLLKQELRLAQTLQAGETTKFYEGDSSLFLVNQREQTTAQIQLSAINAEAKLAELIDITRFFSSTSAS